MFIAYYSQSGKQIMHAAPMQWHLSYSAQPATGGSFLTGDKKYGWRTDTDLFNTS